MRSPESHNHASGAASRSRPTQVDTTAVSRGDWIRTSDLPAPSRMRYQTAPRPESGWRESNPSLRAWKALVQATTPHPRRDESSRGSIRTYVRISLQGRAVRRCGRCGWEKPLSEFAWRRRAKGELHNYCRACHADYRREHCLANRYRYIARAQCHRRRRVNFRAALTGAAPYERRSLAHRPRRLSKRGSEQTKDPANRALCLACSRGTDWGKPVLIVGYPGSTGSHLVLAIL
jgi:hypothetical protein